MSPLAVLAIGALANWLAVGATWLLLPGWEAMVSGVGAFLVACAWKDRVFLAKLEHLKAALDAPMARPR